MLSYNLIGLMGKLEGFFEQVLTIETAHQPNEVPALTFRGLLDPMGTKVGQNILFVPKMSPFLTVV